MDTEENMQNPYLTIPPEQGKEDLKASLQELGEIIEKIEHSKQKSHIKQIEAQDKDNERQYNFALEQEKNETSKWNKGFRMASIIVAVLTLVSIILLFTGEKDIGLGLLASTFSGVFGYLAGNGNCK